MLQVVNKYQHRPTDADVYIGRGSALGNPFTHADLHKTKAEFQCNNREEAIAAYEPWLRTKISERDSAVCTMLNNIVKMARKGDVFLVCFCKPKSCHGDIVKKIVEEVL